MKYQVIKAVGATGAFPMVSTNRWPCKVSIFKALALLSTVRELDNAL
jgi:hypothetical protein